ncbi:MAG: type VI secretion system-associated FHA domain protein [Polyangiales bacterium]
MQPLVIQIERTDERKADTCAFAKSPVRIGRNPLSDLQLDESFVSQWHGVIRFDEGRTTYLDLGSTNPTLVDGEAIQRNVEVEVSETTDIRIGTLRLHLLRVASPPPELFGARRKTVFARADGAANSTAATMYLGSQGPASQKPPPISPPVSQLPAAYSEGSSPRPSSQIPPALSPPPLSQTPPASSSPSRNPPANSTDSDALARTALSLPPAPNLPRSIPPAGPPPLAAAGKAVVATPAAGPRSRAQGLDGSYRDYRSARNEFIAQVRAELDGELAGNRSAVLERLLLSYPELAHEPELRPVLAQLGIETWRTGVPDMTDWLRRLTGGLVPTPGMTTNGALALERIGEVLEVFSSAFIELRTAHEQFCEEMSLEKPDEESVLNTTKNPRAVLAYLLNPDHGQGNRVTDLARAMADFAVHQVALVSAVVEGARDVLRGLSPNVLSGAGERPGQSFFGKLMGQDQKALWARYVAVFDETLDADHFTRKLFGRDFARKYYAITGGRNSLPPPSAARS